MNDCQGGPLPTITTQPIHQSRSKSGGPVSKTLRCLPPLTAVCSRARRGILQKGAPSRCLRSRELSSHLRRLSSGAPGRPATARQDGQNNNAQIRCPTPDHTMVSSALQPPRTRWHGCCARCEQRTSPQHRAWTWVWVTRRAVQSSWSRAQPSQIRSAHSRCR